MDRNIINNINRIRMTSSIKKKMLEFKIPINCQTMSKETGKLRWQGITLKIRKEVRLNNSAKKKKIFKHHMLEYVSNLYFIDEDSITNYYLHFVLAFFNTLQLL